MYKNKSQLLFRRLCLIVVDIISIILSFFLSAFIAYDGSMELSFLKYTYFFIPILLIGSLFFFIIMKLYDSLWSYASINELLNVIIASICSSILYCILCLLIPVHPPISTIFLYLLLLLVFIGGSRFGYRFVRLYASRHYLFGRSDDNESKVMIVGAGSAGEKILRETLVSTKLHKKVVCFIDDDATKHNRRIHNVPIVGGRNEILTQVEKYKIDEIYVALPSIDDKETSKILNICKETKCKIKKLPGMYQFLNDEITLEKLKDVEVQDLLGRDPVQVNLKEIMGDRVRTYALFSYHYQEKKFRQCTMERITRKEKKSLEKGKIYTIRINEENPKKLCYLRKNFQMEDLLTFILGMAFWLSGIFYLIGEFVFFK